MYEINDLLWCCICHHSLFPNPQPPNSSTQLPAGYTGVSLHSLIPAHPPPLWGVCVCVGGGSGLPPHCRRRAAVRQCASSPRRAQSAAPRWLRASVTPRISTQSLGLKGSRSGYTGANKVSIRGLVVSNSAVIYYQVCELWVETDLGYLLVKFTVAARAGSGMNWLIRSVTYSCVIVFHFSSCCALFL